MSRLKRPRGDVSISRCLRHADRERRAEASECVHIQVLDADGGGIAQ